MEKDVEEMREENRQKGDFSAQDGMQNLQEDMGLNDEEFLVYVRMLIEKVKDPAKVNMLKWTIRNVEEKLLQMSEEEKKAMRLEWKVKNEKKKLARARLVE